MSKNLFVNNCHSIYFNWTVMVMGNDSDADGPDHRDCQTAWDNDDPSDPDDRTEDNAWNDRTVFGIITLADFVYYWDIWEYCPDYVALETIKESNISVYPNPAGNTIHFGEEGLSIIKIYSLTGIKLMEVETTGEVDISMLKRGMYLAECKNSFVKFLRE